MLVEQTETEREEDIPLSFAKALLVQARAFGKDVDAIIHRARFPFNPLSTPAEQSPAISVQQYSRLCMELFAALDDESGGIIQGVRTPPGASRMLAYSIIHCQNLREALERAIEFNVVCREPSDNIKTHELRLSEDGKSAIVSYLSVPSEQSEPVPSQDGVLCSMAIWLRLCGWLIDKNIEFLAAGCAGPVPENKAGIQHFFPCPVCFDESCNWVSIPALLLDAPLVRSEEELEAFLKIAPYHIVIAPVVNEKSVAARIREIIGHDFREELPTFEQLTGLLNMSARTLRRRLDKEGTSYQRIKDAARRDAAIRYLGDSNLTVSDVAELVGFSDPSAFHRSFKRWTGVSPGEYR